MDSQMETKGGGIMLCESFREYMGIWNQKGATEIFCISRKEDAMSPVNCDFFPTLAEVLASQRGVTKITF